MEKNAGSSIKYYLAVSAEYKNDLARIRQWSNLKVGFDAHLIWVKDFDYAQIHSGQVKSIPFATAFYQKGNQLFIIESQLPERFTPSLLWTPIDRALPLKLPALNHHYFGVDERIQINLVQRDVEAEAVAMITSANVLEQYIVSAPAIRLEKMRWTILEADRVFLLGTPLLPLSGDTFWARKDLLLPSGFDFELYLLVDVIQRQVNAARDCWVIWNSDGSYSLILKENLVTLSRSSFRLSFNQS
jgi:hypothetical protein